MVLVGDRLFDPGRRTVARELYARVAQLPLVCAHDHVDPMLLADPAATLGSPAQLFVIIQLHAGSMRDHDESTHRRFGPAGVVDEDAAHALASRLAYGLVRRAYPLQETA